MDSHIILRTSKMIDGTGHEPVDDPVVIVTGKTIQNFGIPGDVDLSEYPDAREIRLDGCTLLPGLIDSHVHLALGTGGGYDAMMEESDGIQLITGVPNSVGTALAEGLRSSTIPQKNRFREVTGRDPAGLDQVLKHLAAEMKQLRR